MDDTFRDFYYETNGIHGSTSLIAPIPQRPESDVSSNESRWSIPGERKRKIRPVTIVFFITAAGIFAYGFIGNKEIRYRKTNETSHKSCYLRKDIKTYPVFFNVSLGLIGIILGVLVDRGCLVIEELDQLKSRYNSSFSKLLKSCFSGISWGSISVVFIVVVISYILGKGTEIKVSDAVYVLGGIGVGPFFVQLLNLNTISDVDLSTILEKKQMYPGFTLAWFYYILFLKKKLEDFNNFLSTHEFPELSLDRLILLLPPGTDIANIDDLISKDETIEKISMEGNQIPVCKLKQGQNEDKYFAMLCVKEPLVALKKMQTARKVICVTETSYDNELKQFCKALSEILEDAPDDQYTKKALLVPVTVKIGHYHELRHGGLAKIIMKVVDVNSGTELTV